MLTGDVITIDLLDRNVGNNPGYTMQYLEGNNFSNAERLALIEKMGRNFQRKQRTYIKEAIL